MNMNEFEEKIKNDIKNEKIKNDNEIRMERHNYHKLDDNVSYDEKEKNYLKQIEDEVTEELIKSGHYYIKDGKIEKPETLGLCHIIWGCQKRLLKQIFDFDWQTPQEKNPEIDFD